MSAVDPIAAVLADLHRPAVPRPAFAEALLDRLLGEPTAPTTHHEPSAQPAHPARRRVLPRWRWRVALAIALLLLLLAGIATATYLGVRNWVSSSPRGIQHTTDYRLTTVFTTRVKRTWSSFSLGPGGHDLYALRTDSSGPARGTELVRISGLERGQTKPHVSSLLDFRSISPPHWQPGSCSETPVSVASNGDVFLAACGFDKPYRSAAAGGLGVLLLYVLHPDGARQRILTGDDLVRLKLAPPRGGWWPSMATSAPDRLWIWVDPFEGTAPQRLVQVRDPNRDGDWSDRVVHEVRLPVSMPFARRATKPFHWYPDTSWQLVAEPSLPGDDRSRSVLAATLGSGGFRIYRIADINDDGDALDPGEVQLLFRRRHVGRRGQVTAHVRVTDGVARREIVVAGLSLPDRVSTISASGEIRDIARSFGGVHGTLAGPNGAIYVVDRRNTLLTVYRLGPVRNGADSTTTPVAPPEPAVVTAPPPVASGAARLIFELYGVDRGESFTIGADGTGLRRLVPSTHVYSVCQSADGSMISYWSDAAVPKEGFPFLAKLGDRPIQIPDDASPRYCAFSSRWIFTGSRRYDVLTGREDAVPNALAVQSPDGTKLLPLGHLLPHGTRRMGAQTLDLVDLATLMRRRLAGPHGTAEFESVTWSPTGTRVAYLTSPRPGSWAPVRHRLTVWVRDAATGRALLRLPLHGGRPSLALSADGTQLLVCIEDRGWQPSCPAEQDDHGATDVRHESARLLLVDLRSGSVHVVAHGALMFAAWSPSGAKYAYAVADELFLVRGDGAAQKLTTLPDVQWQHLFILAQPWLGWSPDGRFIGFGIVGSSKNPDYVKERGIPVVDVATGKVRTLRPFGHAQYMNVQWWRS